VSFAKKIHCIVPRISSHYSTRQPDVIFGAICRIIEEKEVCFNHTHLENVIKVITHRLLKKMTFKLFACRRIVCSNLKDETSTRGLCTQRSTSRTGRRFDSLGFGSRCVEPGHKTQTFQKAFPAPTSYHDDHFVREYSDTQTNSAISQNFRELQSGIAPARQNIQFLPAKHSRMLKY